jgi:hypothetical protein
MKPRLLRNPVSLFALGCIVTAIVLLLPGLARAYPGANSEINTGSVQASPFPGKDVSKPAGCAPTWTVVTTPDLDSFFTAFYSVAAITDNDVWAAGINNSEDNNSLFEHWDGVQWNVIQASQVPSSSMGINGLSYASSNDVWAVGQYSVASSSIAQTLVEHWDGAAWAIVQSPNTSITETNLLNKVSALSPSNVWAVGHYSHESVTQTLIEHWDGTQWSIIPSPNVSTNYSHTLYDVAAFADNDVWAVGRYRTDVGQYRTLIEHWDGTQWSIIPSPNANGLSNILRSVTTISANDVWAAGYFVNHGFYQTLIEHWDGSQWSIVPSPNTAQNNNNILRTVFAESSGDIWAAGSYHDGYSYKSLVLHWNGTRWDLVSSPSRPGNNYIYDLQSLLTGQIWAVGTSTDGGDGHTLALHYTDVCSTGTPSPTVTPAVTPTPTACTPGFNLVPGPNGLVASYLQGVTAITTNDVWAVGTYRLELENSYMGLTQHWDGSQWTIVPNDSLGFKQNTLYSVAAYASNDVWAVGGYGSTTSITATLTLIKHWDGTSWTNFASPSPGSYYNALLSVSARAPDDVWAVGYYIDYPSTSVNQKTLVLHWNGSQWNVVTSPNPGTLNNRLNGVVALSASNVWAVGYKQYTGLGEHERTLIEHWNGTQWTEFFDPGPGSYRGSFLAISGIASNDVWAVGSYVDDYSRTLIEHWDGVQWNVMQSPNVGTFNRLVAVHATSANDAWAVGGNSLGAAMVLHWDGSNWGVALTPNPSHEYRELKAITASGANDVWAVGSNGSGTLVEHLDNSCTCNLQFTDAGLDSPFYSFVHCLACRNIISGYACGEPGEPCNPAHDPYYRPSRPITRGQLAKMIAIASQMNYEIPPTSQTFQDVTYGQSSWLWIEQLAAHYVVSGYPCGGPGEPCIPPDNRPYFRPNSNSTRGQISKIVANSAHYDDSIPPDQQTFEDVPPNSTFWRWIEILSEHSIIGGYPCGSVPSEPCIPPANRPYFRPGNNTTRGQMAKITSNTFYPNCQTLQPDQK